MNNVAAQESNKAKRLIEQIGAILLFLPPFSPAFTHIEQYFAAIKKHANVMNMK